MSYEIAITPRDPIVVRDGRPFGRNSGNRMRSLEWPYPSVLAGSLRTLLGKKRPEFDAATVKELKETTVRGPLLQTAGKRFLPRPHDVVVSQDGNTTFSLRPKKLTDGEGCDMPRDVLPAMLAGNTPEFKPAKLPAFWSLDAYVKWLLDPKGTGHAVDPTDERSGDFLPYPKIEQRTHVHIEPQAGAAEEGELFSTAALDPTLNAFPLTPWQMIAHVSSDAFATELEALNQLHPFGGERRLAAWQKETPSDMWKCPQEVRQALTSVKRVRMVLATPAVFEQNESDEGWRPGWLKRSDNGLEGSPPGSGVNLRLVSAVVERWCPISGWSLEPLPETGKPGPKPVRRLVPAGCVYFFETDSAQGLESLWLQSVCDTEQDRRDGFGLATWGVWEPHDEL